MDKRPLKHFYKEVPCNNPASAFSEFVIQAVAEFPDGDGGSFYEVIQDELDEDEGEHLSTCYGIYGRYKDSGMVLNITDRAGLEAAEKFVMELNGVAGTSVFTLAHEDRRHKSDPEPCRLTPDGSWTLLMRPFYDDVMKFNSAMDALKYIQKHGRPGKWLQLEEWKTNGDLVNAVYI